MGLARKNIMSVKPYVAGKPIEETKREFKLKNVVKLASNENPLGPSPKAIAAIRKNLTAINRYPDSNCFYLKKKLAEKFSLKPQNFVLGNGSDELIDIAIKAFVEEDENVLTADTTFLEYKIISQVNNRSIETIPLKNFKYDLKSSSRKINNKTKLVFIANPNNPTGTYVNKYELEEFMNSLPPNVLLVLDEAYDAFIDVDDFPKGKDYISTKNVLAMKTFSKAYGLAGLRVGYAIARPELISYMEQVRQPFNVNLLAQVAATAALADEEFLQKTRNTILEGKYCLYRALNKMGVAYVPSVANFILIDIKNDCTGIFKEMLKYGLIVRDMKEYGLDNFIRVTVGTKKENDKFIKVFKKVMNKGERI